MKPAIVPVTEVREGTWLVADGGFTCLKDGEVCLVQAEKDGSLFVLCDGPEDAMEIHACHHGLDGQLSEDGGSYVGFWLAVEEASK